MRVCSLSPSGISGYGFCCSFFLYINKDTLLHFCYVFLLYENIFFYSSFFFCSSHWRSCLLCGIDPFLMTCIICSLFHILRLFSFSFFLNLSLKPVSLHKHSYIGVPVRGASSMPHNGIEQVKQCNPLHEGFNYVFLKWECDR